MPHSGPAPSPQLPSIGVRIPPWVGFTRNIWQGLLEAATITGGWRFVVDRTKSLGELPPVSLNEDWSGDGFITFRMSEEEGKTWSAANMPVVNLSSEGPSPGFPRVIPDNEQAGRIAAQHLSAAGLPNLAYIGRQTSIHANPAWASGTPRRYSLERWNGFAEEARKKGFHPTCHFLSGRDLAKKEAWKGIEKEICTFLKTLPIPCGIFAADDQLALVIMRATRVLDMEVPQEISVVGFGDDPEVCFTALPPLTSVAYPGKAIGLHAAKALTDLMQGGHPPETIRVPVSSVVERGSSAFLPSNDPIVGKLLHFIREQAPARPLQVAELPDLTPWGSTTVKKKILNVLGHGPKEEIKRVRVARLKNLLSSTDLPLAEISISMGFGSPQDMSRFCTRETGQTPSEFRSNSRGRPSEA
jgi:LacI family transcriptional regulator